jgi:hypothetical protein
MVNFVLRVLARALAVAAISMSISLVGGIAGQNENGIATVVFIRHGEKPEGGFGQLNCQGLNRALTLAPFIAETFGKPNAIFAPNPSHPKEDGGNTYDYVRPLATIEPTAIWFGLPVDVTLDVYDRDGLQDAIEKHRASDHNVLILVAWEHKQIASIVRSLLDAHHADPAIVTDVKDWESKDFDSMYVVRIERLGDSTKATFEHKHEGLDGLPNTCPH